MTSRLGAYRHVLGGGEGPPAEDRVVGMWDASEAPEVETFGGYRRRINGWDDSKVKRRDVPRDMDKLLDEVESLDWWDKIIVDCEYYPE